MSEGFWNRQAYFNFSKRGHKLFYELVRQSDVYIENNAADVVEQLGLDYRQLSAVNPRLIMVRFPGFGIRGPYREFKVSRYRRQHELEPRISDWTEARTRGDVVTRLRAVGCRRRRWCASRS